MKKTLLVDVPAKTVRGFGPAEVMAFAEGNKALLKDLLAPDVYEGFVAAIVNQEAL